MDHLDDIMADIGALRVHRKTQLLHEPCGEQSGLHRLGSGVGGKEKPLIETAVMT